MNKKLYSVGLAALTLSAQAMYGMEFDEQMERAMALSMQDGQQQEYVEDDDMFAAIAASLQEVDKQECVEDDDDILAAIAASLQDVDKQEVNDEYEEALVLSNLEYHEKIQEENDNNCLNDELLRLIEENGTVHDVLRLINNGAQVNVRYNDNITPLMVAARENRPVICALLIGKGAQINTEDNKGNTPLDYAISTNNSKMCKLFVVRGADLNPISDYTDSTLLGRALLRKCDLVLYKNLSNCGAKL